MSISIMSSVWKHSTADGKTLLVLLAIADFANDEGEAWPSVETLSKKARCSTRTVQYAIRSLEAAEELKVVYSGGRGRATPNRYTVQGMQGTEASKGASSDSLRVQPLAPDPSEKTIKNTTKERVRKTSALRRGGIASAARSLSNHLYDEHARLFVLDDGETPLKLTASFARALGESKHLLGLQTPRNVLRPADGLLEGMKNLVTEWMEEWNEDPKHTIERHDFSMTAFVQRYIVIKSWSDGRKR